MFDRGGGASRGHSKESYLAGQVESVEKAKKHAQTWLVGLVSGSLPNGISSHVFRQTWLYKAQIWAASIHHLM